MFTGRLRIWDGSHRDIQLIRWTQLYGAITLSRMVVLPWSQTARESTLALGWPDGRFSPIKVLVGSALRLVSSRYLARRGEESWALSKGPMIKR